MNNLKQEWFVDFTPRRVTYPIIRLPPKAEVSNPSRSRNPDSQPLTDQHVKITVKA